jgi:hypothetical protein
MTRDGDASDTETTYDDGGELEAEAQALVDRFNDAKSPFSPELEWFSMSYDHETGGQSFVFEAAEYIDRGGLSAIRECGRTVHYIEAHEYESDVKVQIHIRVQGGVQG